MSDVRWWLFSMFAVAIQLTTSGCWGGGDGAGDSLSGFFGGGGSDGVFSFASSSSADSGSGGSGGFAADLGGGTGGSAGSIATLHNPEPASIALFGGGLAGAAWLSRRRRMPRPGHKKHKKA